MMYRRRVTRKRHDPLEAKGHLEEVTEFGQRLASDFIIVRSLIRMIKNQLCWLSEMSTQVTLLHTHVLREPRKSL